MTDYASFSLDAPGGAPLACYRWSGPEIPHGVVQIAHGRGEHSLRYAAFAAACVEAGLAVFANDHQGHGRTAKSGQLGDFGPRGFAGLADDMAMLTRDIARQFPGVPIMLLGHSMGSFAAQLYLQDHAALLSGLVLSGSAALDVRYAALAAAPMAYNAGFQPQRTPFDWLSRDPAKVDAYIADPLCGFDLKPESQRSMAQIAPATIPRAPLTGLPVLLLTGSEDPVNGNLQWFHPLADRYRAAGAAVTTQIYEGGRHEMLNETNRAEVTAALIAWIVSVTSAEAR
jgi:alpha-beta hydrolase superfamily lysophospholipase